MELAATIFLSLFVCIVWMVFDTWRERPVNLAKLYGVCCFIVVFLVLLAFSVGLWVGNHAN